MHLFEDWFLKDATSAHTSPASALSSTSHWSLSPAVQSVFYAPVYLSTPNLKVSVVRRLWGTVSKTFRISKCEASAIIRKQLDCPAMSYPWYTHASYIQLLKLSVVSWEIASDRICPITDEVRPLLRSLSWKMDVMFTFFQSSETFHSFHFILKIIRLAPQQHQPAPLVAMDILHLNILACLCLIV